MKYNRGFLKFPHMRKRMVSAVKNRKTFRCDITLFSETSEVICILRFRYCWGEMIDIYLADGKTIVGEIFALKGRIKFHAPSGANEKEKGNVRKGKGKIPQTSTVQKPEIGGSKEGGYPEASETALFGHRYKVTSGTGGF